MKIFAARSKAGGRVSGFTLVEIAISLAVIGIALVAIIGVLPIGMNVQKENRETTIINQDATIFLEAIRGGARGLDDLTNYVYAVTNFWAEYKNGAPTGVIGVNGYAYLTASVASGFPSGTGIGITNGLNIIGLLSTPEFLDANGFPINNLFENANNNYSNHIIAYVRSISGQAIEKPPQDNDLIRGDAFGYRILCVNAPTAMDTNLFSLSSDQRVYADQLAANLHELRLTFLWPTLPNGNVGPGRQTFRALIAGQFAQANNNGQRLYFYQSQSFTNAP